ncbi:MAG: hypothetical protein QF486_00290 [Candidatus Woesearchaeota archaeon]|nr:hypothetical protein [Candidatus Woesearchaeota archaeon]MDP7181338.1 hypothetical protein [Candidatus Woesearchaeota archaeon]MDP7198043.1 hypothetical protein [Candidatus Woesearchaeota archaeon]MDP7466877.1 hypothetical protein [Candidatus Woesearchaeota archaeon]
MGRHQILGVSHFGPLEVFDPNGTMTRSVQLNRGELIMPATDGDLLYLSLDMGALRRNRDITLRGEDRVTGLVCCEGTSPHKVLVDDVLPREMPGQFLFERHEGLSFDEMDVNPKHVPLDRFGGMIVALPREKYANTVITDVLSAGTRYLVHTSLHPTTLRSRQIEGLVRLDTYSNRDVPMHSAYLRSGEVLPQEEVKELAIEALDALPIPPGIWIEGRGEHFFATYSPHGPEDPIRLRTAFDKPHRVPKDVCAKLTHGEHAYFLSRTQTQDKDGVVRIQTPGRFSAYTIKMHSLSPLIDMS